MDCVFYDSLISGYMSLQKPKLKLTKFIQWIAAIFNKTNKKMSFKQILETHI